MQIARQTLQTRGLSSAVQESRLLALVACLPSLLAAGPHAALSCAAQQGPDGRAGTAVGLLGATRKTAS